MNVLLYTMKLKIVLRFKPYRSAHVQALTPEIRERRESACIRFLEQGENWQRRVIWSDEKWFCLIPHPNRKNEVFWSVENPHNLEEVRVQGASKVMAWAGFVDGRFLPIHWFEGSVNGESYNKLLKEKVWPSVRSKASRKGYWFMQDGATPHTTANSLFYLKDKFSARVVSNKTDFPWPPKSPDLNPLDFYFWGVAEKEVFDKKPKSLEELKLIVENFAKGISQDTLLRVADNFCTRAKLCIQEEGGHFEYLLKKKK